ncbi:PREDICTED: cinnamoyl-CoA reductase 2-like [Theobroma cacao]|uniref:Cinnamoyl-CoA reductase 2-like n=1 Tax=Theobroma cacao TaxID=3641 RepID=A0AB32WPN4_THECC|nr:PREDICTED: cinnamoyl-CoA reductase 2-like [Theobroma cacao]
MGGKERVCVTGARGFLASWIIKFLLLKGYHVHGTVRDPGDDKNAHLKELDKASENLQLFQTDLLNSDGLCAAIAGCTGVFHVASPAPPADAVINSEELMEPAVTGTRNVLDACLKTEVKKVVVVSSIGAIALNPKWPKGQVMNENCWSDLAFCKEIKAESLFATIVLLSKTAAESEAWEYAKRSGLSIVTICPSVIIGPLLQPTMNSSSLYLLKFLQGFSTESDDDHAIYKP